MQHILDEANEACKYTEGLSFDEFVEDGETVVALGLTVRNRLSVLYSTAPENYYEEFNIVPQGLMERLRQGRIKVINWHKLSWESKSRYKRKRSWIITVVSENGVKLFRLIQMICRKYCKTAANYNACWLCA